MNRPELSIVVCVYNEELNVQPLIQAIKKALHGISYEIIYVDDGSTDGTLKSLRTVNDVPLTVIELRKNYGQSTALAAGIDHAKGEYIVTMDGDMQNDPDDIPMMLELAKKENWDLIAGIRANRKDGMLLRKIPSSIANFIIQRTSGIRIKDYGCTLKIFKHEIAKDIGLYGELHRFIPLLAHLEGATIHQVNVKHHERKFGESKYGLNRTFKVVVDLLLMLFFKKYMNKPMHLFGIAGLLVFAIGVIINLYLLYLKILGQDIWGKPLLILGVILLLAGIQLITSGIVFEILMRIYYESQEKSTYRVRNVFHSVYKKAVEH